MQVSRALLETVKLTDEGYATTLGEVGKATGNISSAEVAFELILILSWRADDEYLSLLIHGEHAISQGHFASAFCMF